MPLIRELLVVHGRREAVALNRPIVVLLVVSKARVPPGPGVEIGQVAAADRITLRTVDRANQEALVDPLTSVLRNRLAEISDERLAEVARRGILRVLGGLCLRRFAICRCLLLPLLRL